MSKWINTALSIVVGEGIASCWLHERILSILLETILVLVGRVESILEVVGVAIEIGIGREAVALVLVERRRVIAAKLLGVVEIRGILLRLVLDERV